MTGTDDDQQDPADLPEERSIFDPGEDFEILPAENGLTENEPTENGPTENAGVQRVATLDELLNSAPIDLIRRPRAVAAEQHETADALTDCSDEDIARAHIILAAAGWSPHPVSHLSYQTRADLVELTGTYLATAYKLIHPEMD